MSAPTKYKTVQTRILAYAQEIGWTVVSRAEAERRRGFDPPSPRLRRADAEAVTADERARRASLYFGDLLHGKLREFNPLYQELEGASIGQWPMLAKRAGPIFPANHKTLTGCARKWGEMLATLAQVARELGVPFQSNAATACCRIQRPCKSP